MGTINVHEHCVQVYMHLTSCLVLGKKYTLYPKVALSYYMYVHVYVHVHLYVSQLVVVTCHVTSLDQRQQQ